MTETEASESATRGGPRLIRVLWRYRWMSVFITLASMAVGLTLATQFAGEPTATARLVLADPRGNAVFRQGVTSEATFIRYLAQRADLAQSEPILSRASDSLRATDRDLDVASLRPRVRTSSEDSDDLIVIASGREPRQAAAIANAVTEAYRAATLAEHTDQRDAMIAAVEEARQRMVDRGEDGGTNSPQQQATAEALARLEIRIADILVDTSTFGDGVLFSEPAAAGAASTTLPPVRTAVVSALLGVALALGIGLVREEQSGRDWPGEDAGSDTELDGRSQVPDDDGDGQVDFGPESSVAGSGPGPTWVDPWKYLESDRKPTWVEADVMHEPHSEQTWMQPGAGAEPEDEDEIYG